MKPGVVWIHGTHSRHGETGSILQCGQGFRIWLVGPELRFNFDLMLNEVREGKGYS